MMMEEASGKAFDALLSYGVAGIFSAAFLMLTIWLLRFGMTEAKAQFQMIHSEIADLNQKIMNMSVLVARLEENVISLLEEKRSR